MKLKKADISSSVIGFSYSVEFMLAGGRSRVGKLIKLKKGRFIGEIQKTDSFGIKANSKKCTI